MAPVSGNCGWPLSAGCSSGKLLSASLSNAFFPLAVLRICSRHLSALRSWCEERQFPGGNSLRLHLLRQARRISRKVQGWQRSAQHVRNRTGWVPQKGNGSCQIDPLDPPDPLAWIPLNRSPGGGLISIDGLKMSGDGYGLSSTVPASTPNPAEGLVKIGADRIDLPAAAAATGSGLSAQ